MKISIVVPVYNVEKYIGEMIESLQRQTLTDLEIILVDDGSPDNSGKICDQYAENDSRIRVIHKKNAGVGAARNDGLEAATGEWIIFCDSDDWLELDALEKLVAVGEKNNVDIAFGDVNLVYGDTIKKVQFYKDEFVTDDRQLIDKLIQADFSRAYCYNPPEDGTVLGFYGGPWNKIVRRQFLLDNDIKFDLRVKGIFDDVIYTAYIFAAANRVAYVHIPIYNYRQLGSSITHTYKANLLEINDAIFNSWQEFLAKYDKNRQFQKPFYANVIRRLDYSLGLYFFSSKNTKPIREQLAELNDLIDREPYNAAIQNVDPTKFHSRFEKHIWKAAKNHSARRIYYLFKLRLFKKRIKEIIKL